MDLLRQNEEFYAEVLFRLSAIFSRGQLLLLINQAAITSVLFPLFFEKSLFKQKCGRLEFKNAKLREKCFHGFYTVSCSTHKVTHFSLDAHYLFLQDLSKG